MKLLFVFGIIGASCQMLADTTDVYYFRTGTPTIRMTFADGVTHVEPNDEQQVDNAIDQCKYGYGPGNYPVSIRKIGTYSYETVCGLMEDHRR